MLFLSTKQTVNLWWHFCWFQFLLPPQNSLTLRVSSTSHTSRKAFFTILHSLRLSDIKGALVVLTVSSSQSDLVRLFTSDSWYDTHTQPDIPYALNFSCDSRWFSSRWRSLVFPCLLNACNTVLYDLPPHLRERGGWILGKCFMRAFTKFSPLPL